ncbi:hypothetical protein RM717_30385 [Streptomyces griseus]|uniref:Integral membrane protein n=1 Tax=Streptomyces stephensoniae TaxID=3375367 RepID=A0ABU2WAD3_9ACTN|nr:hypothetical protein [Streptomyces griseus]MDT0494807.1 hypothetical protein [Streptomyces griseus]
MDGSVLDVAGYVLRIVGGLAIACIGVVSLLRPDRAPLAGGPSWLVRCGSVGWLLMGCAVVSHGGFDLVGRGEDWPLDAAGTAGFWLVAISLGVGAVFELPRLYAGRGQRRKRS